MADAEESPKKAARSAAVSEPEIANTRDDSGAEEDIRQPACCCVRCQSTLQATLRPGYWIPGLRSLHAKEEM